MKKEDIEMIRTAMEGKQKGESPEVISVIFDKLHISRYRHETSKRTAKQQRDLIQKKK